MAAAYGVVDAQHALAARWTFYIGPDGKILDVDNNVRPENGLRGGRQELESLKVRKVK